MMVCYDKQTYKSLAQFVSGDDGDQISFACSPERNYTIDPEIFVFDEAKQELIAEFRNGSDVIGKYVLPIGHLINCR